MQNFTRKSFLGQWSCERRAWTCEQFCIKRSKSGQSRPRKEGGRNGFRRTWAILARPSVWSCSSLFILAHPSRPYLPRLGTIQAKFFYLISQHLSVRLSPHLDPIISLYHALNSYMHQIASSGPLLETERHPSRAHRAREAHSGGTDSLSTINNVASRAAPTNSNRAFELLYPDLWRADSFILGM